MGKYDQLNLESRVRGLRKRFRPWMTDAEVSAHRLGDRAILKAAVQNARVCQVSGKVLRPRTAVLVALVGEHTTITAVLDGSVYDERAHVLARYPRVAVTVLDGRVINSARHGG